MDKLHYKFDEIDSDDSISKLAEVFNTTPEKGLIKIPSSIGIGIIKKVKLDDGIVMRIWDFNLTKPIVFQKQPHRFIKEEKYFHIGYLLNTDSLELNNK